MRPPPAPAAHAAPAVCAAPAAWPLPAAGSARPTGRPQGRRGWRLPAALLPLALALHLALLQALQPAQPPPVRLPAPGQTLPAVQARLVAAGPAAPQATADAARPPAPAAPATTDGATPAVTLAATPIAPADAAALRAAPSVVPLASAAAPAAATPPADPVASPTANPTADPITDPIADPTAGLSEDPSAAASPPLRPPPLYAARVPPPTQAVYAFQRAGRQSASGQAVLDWQHDGARYRLQLQAHAADGRLLLQQTSQGGIDGHGLVPQRLLARGRGSRQLAVNFDWQAARIGFSGVAARHVAWPGVQDALGWLPQLLAVLAGTPAAQALELVVVDPRGGVATWAWQQRAAQTLAAPWGDAPATHWQRLPPTPDGLQVDLWLAVPPGRTKPWPLRLRWQLPRHGHVQQLDLLAAPAAPSDGPAAPAAAAPVAPPPASGAGAWPGS